MESESLTKYIGYNEGSGKQYPGALLSINV